MVLTRTTNLKESKMTSIKEMFKKFVDWHEEFTDDIRWKFNFSHYQIMWFSWFEGVATVLILQWIF